MERLTIPDVRLDGNTIKRSIIDAQKVKECAMELYWRLKDIEDAIADEESEEYDLSRLREMVQADREGRIKIIPERIGKSCGTCARFQRIPGTRRGKCEIKPVAKGRYGSSWDFEPSQSRKACKDYEPKKGDFALKEREKDES